MRGLALERAFRFAFAPGLRGTPSLMRRRPGGALGFCLLRREAEQGNQAYGKGKQKVGEAARHQEVKRGGRSDR